MTLPIKKVPWQSNLKLTYVSDNETGFYRKKKGKKFTYLDEQARRLKCKKTLRRIKSLGIPPMWKKVWICKSERGHLQSTGRDLKKRKQYIYHVDWTAYRQATKFSKMLDFAKALPKLRVVTDKHLKAKKWNRKKVLALAVKVLDEHHIRIGNRQYTERNGTFGLTTLRRKHIDIEDGELIFSYKAKSNKFREVSLSDRKLIKLVKECSELPGYEVFRYRDKKGRMRSIDSSDVNQYIHEIMGNNFTAKDFRTWAGTSLAVKYLSKAKKVLEKKPRKKLDVTLVKMVAKELGNTVAVCRKYYIHPQILKLVKEDVMPKFKLKEHEYLEDFEVKTKKLLKRFQKG